MKAALLLLLAGLGSLAQAEDFVLVPVNPTPVRLTTSSATLTPEGVYWTFNSPRASVTLTPRGESYTTFRGTNASVTLLPKGRLIFTVQDR